MLGLEVRIVLRSFLVNSLQPFVMGAFVAAGHPFTVRAYFVPHALTCRLWDRCRSGVSVAVTLSYPEHMPFFIQFLVYRGCLWSCF